MLPTLAAFISYKLKYALSMCLATGTGVDNATKPPVCLDNEVIALLVPAQMKRADAQELFPLERKPPINKQPTCTAKFKDGLLKNHSSHITTKTLDHWCLLESSAQWAT